MANIKMPNDNKNLCIVALCISLVLASAWAVVADNYNRADAVVPPETVCYSTLNPSYCRSVLANQNGSVYDYCRLSVRKSLFQSQKFLNVVYSYLQNPSSLSQSTIGAINDCQFLAQLNFEYLSNSHDTVDKASNVLPASQAEDVHTLLSAVLTNQQTCLDGLQTSASDPRVKKGISSPLTDDAKLNSVSLYLFTKAWTPDNKKWQQHNHHQSPSKMPKKVQQHIHHQSPPKMPKEVKQHKHHQSPPKMPRVRTAYDSAKGHGRKLLQSQASDDSDRVVVSDIVVVSKDGSGNFTTINDAIAAAPNNTAASAGYFIIYITEGIYQEYVSIDKHKKFLMLIGDGINRTIITGDRNVIDGFTTFNSATFAVVGQGFVAMNITFRNTAGPSKHQAVAVRNGADMSTFYSCSFEGYQDTLYAHSMRQFYRECDIYGTVDFIFGNAAVVFQNCNIYPRVPMIGQFNAITAQGRTDPNQNTGISIQNATIKAAGDLAPLIGSVETYLGRPWKEYSRTVYMQSSMDSLIAPTGWREWNGNFALNTLYYAEYDNKGPGSNTGSRVNWRGYRVINATDAAKFTVSNFLAGDDWVPQTSVPFKAQI